MKNILFALTLLVNSTTHAADRFAEVGDVLPDVAVQTIEGQSRSLRALVAEQPSVLIFYRGGWCPFCNRHLAALSEIQSELRAEGYRLLAISPDQPEKLQASIKKQKLAYTLLSDSSAAAAKGLGITFRFPDKTFEKYRSSYGIDLEAYSGQKHHLLPHPAVFITDTKSVIRFAHVNKDYKTRLDPKKILQAAREAGE